MGRQNCPKCGRVMEIGYVEEKLISEGASRWNWLCGKCVDKINKRNKREGVTPKKAKYYDCSECKGSGKIKGHTCVQCNGSGKSGYQIW